MDEGILVSVKKMLGIEDCCDSFDNELMIHINSALSVLYQLGVPANSYAISLSNETWSDIFELDDTILNLIKTYIYAKVRLIFDPPTTSFVLDSLNSQIKEMEWRIYIDAGGGFDERDEC